MKLYQTTDKSVKLLLLLILPKNEQESKKSGVAQSLACKKVFDEDFFRFGFVMC